MTVHKIEGLFGLVLAGGKSSRMGFDKGLIQYHHQPQRIYLYQLLNHLCESTFLGIRQEQETGTGGLPVIKDSEKYQGPFNSLLAAHEAYQNKAWLVVACDLPFLSKSSLLKLIRERDRSKVATAYYNPEHDFPEPLVAIWEPEGLVKAKLYATEGHYSPGKFLHNHNYQKVLPAQPQELMNVNKPAEFEEVREKLDRTRPQGPGVE